MLSDFPEFHNSAPVLVFEDAVLSDDNNNGTTIIVRKASKKIGFMTLKVMEIYEFHSEGKIQRIAMKAQ